MERKAEDAVVRTEDIIEAMDPLSKPYDDLPAVSDQPCGNIEEAKSQGLQEPLVVHAPFAWNSWQGNRSSERPYLVSRIKFSITARCR